MLQNKDSLFTRQQFEIQIFLPYSSNTFRISQKGQPSYKGQKRLSQKSLFREPTVFIVHLHSMYATRSEAQASTHVYTFMCKWELVQRLPGFNWYSEMWGMSPPTQVNWFWTNFCRLRFWIHSMPQWRLTANGVSIHMQHTHSQLKTPSFGWLPQC
jgi:hypothetical protein